MKKPGLVARALAAAALLSTGACLATTEDVREGVDRANEALLALDHARSVLEATDDVVPIATETALVETRDAAVERALASIDDALARVAPDSRTADALRVRKGWLLLSAGRYASARSAFAEVTAPRCASETGRSSTSATSWRSGSATRRPREPSSSRSPPTSCAPR